MNAIIRENIIEHNPHKSVLPSVDAKDEVLLSAATDPDIVKSANTAESAIPV